MIQISNASLHLSQDLCNPHSDDEGALSTLPDPRSGPITPIDGISSPNLHHPDLNEEIASLSNKLIRAINHQTNLDDTLSATRLELEAARDQVKQLERENRLHLDLLARGFLVRKSAADSAQAALVASISEERKKRVEVEIEKKNMEQELENLTTALFEEANKMVIAARERAEKELDIAKRKNDQLNARLADTESLLRSHQDQLAELKQVMEQMNERRHDQTNIPSPLSSTFRSSYSKECLENNAVIDHIIPFHEPSTPAYPTSFTNLLQTVLRTDLPSYEEFASLLRTSRNASGGGGGGRMSAGSYSGIGMSLGLGSHSGTVSASTNNGPASSLSTILTFPATPITPCSSNSASFTNGFGSSTPLKDTRFYKRIFIEDIEPTLRLDSAPGLSWLARRTVVNAVSEGTLIVEPIIVPTNNINACALCGESRNEPEYSRSHRLRSSLSENAQRYPLCRYCLGRVRSTCDFVGFLRLLKDGHWRCDDSDGEKAAWENCVRLREQMFWSRVGGGVVPVMHHNHHDIPRSPCITEDHDMEQDRKSSDKIMSDEVIGTKTLTTAKEKTQAEKATIPSFLSQNNSVHDMAKNNGTERETPRTSPPPTAFTPIVTSSDVGEKRGSKPLSITIPDILD